MSELDFKMPDVGEGLNEAEIVEWLVEVGDSVTEDQAVVVVQTDKAVVDIPSPADGVVVGHGAPVGDIVLIGATLFRLEVVGTAPDPSDHRRSTPADTPAGAAVVPQQLAPARPKASPATRKRALELGVLLAGVTGSGPGGRIMTADIEASTSAAMIAPANGPTAPVGAVPSGHDRVEPLRGTRRQIARAMTESWRTVPHVTELREIDAVELVRAQRSLRAHLEPDGVRLTFLPLFIKATVAALKAHPGFNASLDFDNELITYRSRYNIGIAMSSDEGLVVPVIHDADLKSLVDLARELDALTVAARNRSLTLDQMSGGTFTISNYGSYGTWMGTPIIRPPEAAIAAFGRVRDAVVAIDGRAVVRTVLPLAVSADHRLNDGHHLGAFVSTLAHFLSDPVLLISGSNS